MGINVIKVPIIPKFISLAVMVLKLFHKYFSVLPGGVKFNSPPFEYQPILVTPF